jgi:hypothetical protein
LKASSEKAKVGFGGHDEAWPSEDGVWIPASAGMTRMVLLHP